MAQSSLRSRMNVVVLVCVVPAVIGTAVSLFTLQAITNKINQIDQHSVRPLAVLGDLRDLAGDTRVEVLEYVASTAPNRAGRAAQIAETDARTDRDIASYLSRHGAATDAAGRLMTRFSAALTEFRAVREQVRSATDDGRPADAYALATGRLQTASETMADPLDQLYQSEVATAASRAGQAARTYRSARYLILAIAVANLVLAFATAFVLTRRMMRTIGRISQVIAGGSLDERVGPTGDSTELGRVGLALDRMFDILAAQRAELVAGQSARDAQADAAAVRQRLGEREVRHRAQAAVDETSKSVLTELQDVRQQAETVRRASDEIEQRAAEAEERTRSVVASAQTAERVVLAVADSLQRVDGITTLIAGVAAQTNLLALNASIEATRAGAAGKGFAVVAGEVKGLAANTQASTVEITETVSALRLDAAAMSASITAMTQGVDGINLATHEVTTVATRQRGAVARLDQCVSEAVGRIKTMSQFSDRLERRRDERIGVTGQVVLRFAGRSIETRLHDLSKSGLMCVSDDESPPAEGMQLEATVNLGDRQHTVEAVVRRRFADADGERLGLQFVNLAPVAAQAINDWLAALLADSGTRGAIELDQD